MVEVLNRQRGVSVDTERWRAFTETVLNVIPAHSPGATIAFVSDRTMRALYRTWRGKAGSTDVLSFPSEQSEFEKTIDATVGDVVISIQQAGRQAKENGLSLDTEISQLILHGLLHLCGYDHETDNGEMNRLEVKLRRKLKISE